MNKFLKLLFVMTLVLSLILSGCSSSVKELPSPTPTPEIVVTPTLTPNPTIIPTQAPTPKPTKRPSGGGGGGGGSSNPPISTPVPTVAPTVAPTAAPYPTATPISSLSEITPESVGNFELNSTEPVAVTGEMTIPQQVNLNIGAGTTVNVPSGANLNVVGVLNNNGTVKSDGTIIVAPNAVLANNGEINCSTAGRQIAPFSARMSRNGVLAPLAEERPNPVAKKLQINGQYQGFKDSILRFDTFDDILTKQNDCVFMYTDSQVFIGGVEYIGKTENAKMQLGKGNLDPTQNEPVAMWGFNGDGLLMMVVYGEVIVQETTAEALNVRIIVKGERVNNPAVVKIKDFNVLKKSAVVNNSLELNSSIFVEAGARLYLWDTDKKTYIPLVGHNDDFNKFLIDCVPIIRANNYPDNRVGFSVVNYDGSVGQRSGISFWFKGEINTDLGMEKYVPNEKILPQDVQANGDLPAVPLNWKHNGVKMGLDGQPLPVYTKVTTEAEFVNALNSDDPKLSIEIPEGVNLTLTQPLDAKKIANLKISGTLSTSAVLTLLNNTKFYGTNIITILPNGNINFDGNANVLRNGITIADGQIIYDLSNRSLIIDGTVSVSKWSFINISEITASGVINVALDAKLTIFANKGLINNGKIDNQGEIEVLVFVDENDATTKASDFSTLTTAPNVTLSFAIDTFTKSQKISEYVGRGFKNFVVGWRSFNSLDAGQTLTIPSGVTLKMQGWNINEFANNGTISIENGGTLFVDSNYTLNNNASIINNGRINGYAKITNASAGTITGDGTNDGTLIP